MIAITIVALTLLAQSTPALGYYTDPTCRWVRSSANLYLYYQWGPEIDYPAPGGLSWRSAFQYAAGDWTATPTVVFIRPGGTQFNFDTYYALDGTRGRMALMRWTSPANCLDMYPQGNRAYFRSLFEAEHTANHEIGHGLPLAHSQYNVALMWSEYNAVGVPQQDDINGVNWMYP